MKSMKEKIATNIHNKARLQMPQLPPFDKLPLQLQQQAMVMVDACLDALTEPTEAMHEAVLDMTPDQAPDVYWKVYLQAAKDGK